MTSKRVLIVEDDSWLAQQHQRVLRAAGFEATISPNALSAISAVDEHHPDVIVLDVLLTGSTAFALLHELQSYGDTGDIPIILCTSLASDLEQENLSAYGVKKVLDKTTMVPDDVVAAVRSVVS
ncbi:MAG TPA: response regulator [Candidatus Saccharimonadales bacterium]|nr:response regulator [Candidatus Saccharimonadales bacterium]